METNIQEYRRAVSAIKEAILHSQYRAVKMVTGEQLSLYFGIGGYVSAHSRQKVWGTSAIDRISEQLRRDLPGLRGFSAQNIRNMRSFFEYWAKYLICSPTASKLQITAIESEIDIDSFSLQKWSPMASEINRDEFLGISFSHHIEYVIRDYNHPMGVATYKTAQDMSEDLRKALPDMDEMRRLLTESEK